MAADSRFSAQIGSRSIPVVPALLVAIVAGAFVGTMLGRYGPGASTDPGAAVVTPSPTPSTMAPASPIAAATSAPTATSGPTSTHVPGLLLDISGDGDAVSEEFSVSRGWRIQWQIDGPSIVLTLRDADGTTKILEQPGPAVGVTQPIPSGTFTLEINAEGPWTLRVVQP